MFKKALLLAACIPIGGFAVNVDLGIGGDRGIGGERDYDRDTEFYYEQDSYGPPSTYGRPYYTEGRFDYRERDLLRDEDVRRVLTKIIRSFDLRDNGKNLDIQVRNGRVFVRGEVQTSREREKLHRLLDTLESLEFNAQVSVMDKSLRKEYRRNINRNGLPPEAYRMRSSHTSPLIAEASETKESRESNVSDGELRRRIRDELKNTWFASYEDVTVDVNDGVVTFTGIVESEDDLQDVEDKFKGMRGVRMIKNNLTVMDPEERAHAKGLTDDQIRKKIDHELKDSWWGAYENVQVEVDDGVVILKGEVNKESDIADIEDRLSGIPGIKVIRTRLTLKSK